MAQPVGEAAINALLREQARRQAMVDRLVLSSPWRRFAAMHLPSIVTAAVFSIVFSVLGRAPRWLEFVALVGFMGVIWLGLELVDVARRLHAVTSVLKETGALTDFVEQSVPTLVTGSELAPRRDRAEA